MLHDASACWWASPNPPLSRMAPMRLRTSSEVLFSCQHTCVLSIPNFPWRKKLSLHLFFSDPLVKSHQPIYIRLRRQQFTHLIPVLPKLRIYCTFLYCQRSILVLQAADRRQLFETMRIKCFLCRAMQFNLLRMVSSKFLRIPRLLIGCEYLARLVICGNMAFEIGDLAHPPFHFLDLCGQLAMFCRRCLCSACQFFIIEQAMLRKIRHRLCHLLEIEHLGPVLIPWPFPCVQLRLNVNQQADAGLLLRRCSPLARAMCSFSSNDRAQRRFIVPLSK